ncbi:hypothetical protein H4R18_001357 [Coemansia javaensis]|uniref:Uncharacterized protein n=1 Tax=Coemansia javaensis TaxID=2761396 RepID=A0A9W8HFF9_9FUNG|nr:hypothetical protein H4R18_001357 [Coemansia javaensis]
MPRHTRRPLRPGGAGPSPSYSSGSGSCRAAPRRERNHDFARMRRQMCRYVGSLGLDPPPPAAGQYRSMLPAAAEYRSMLPANVEYMPPPAPAVECGPAESTLHASAAASAAVAAGPAGPRAQDASGGFALRYANVAARPCRAQLLPPAQAAGLRLPAKHSSPGSSDGQDDSDGSSELTLLEELLHPDDE